MAINSENWQNSCLATSNLKASILVGGNNQSNPRLFYVLSVSDHEDRIEYFREEFGQLEKALETINTNYGHWNYYDMNKPSPKKEGGCGSCAAH